jgi:hypothetical protein
VLQFAHLESRLPNSLGVLRLGERIKAEKEDDIRVEKSNRGFNYRRSFGAGKAGIL